MSVAIALLLLAAGGQGGADGTAIAKDAPAEEKVCRRAKETGSRIRAKRTCRTRAEWEEMDAAASRTLENSRTMSRP